MSGDPIERIANWILRMNPDELQLLKDYLARGGGDGAGVGSVIPPNLPLKEGGAEQPFEKWPAEYFESME